jgi:hypothetical protein
MPRHKLLKRGDILKHEDGSVYIVTEDQSDYSMTNIDVATIVECSEEYKNEEIGSLYLRWGQWSVIGHMQEGWDGCA